MYSSMKDKVTHLAIIYSILTQVWEKKNYSYF